MRQSQLFTKTRKEAPKDEASKNARLLIQAGFIEKVMAGVYSYLPLGLRVLNKVENIIREEMNSIGGQELFLTSLQDPEIWQRSGRWDDEAIDVWFKTKLANDSEIGLATTHEEPIAKLMVEHIRSYKDLPVYAYQFQTKFRNELRAKSGIMRGREFKMKDLYSFNKNEENFREFYEECAQAYARIFSRVGVGDKTYRTFASGGSFSKFSDEFQTISDAGEDIIYIDKDKNIAVNEEVYEDSVLEELDLKKENLVKEKAIEVGNIFPLGTKYAEAMDLFYNDESGEKRPVTMGSYGIGPGRLVGAVVEIFSDEKGMVWPDSIAPFKAHIILVDTENKEQSRAANQIYKELTNKNIEVLFDDRNISAGEKFADSDLIGIPHRITIGKKFLESDLIEYTERATGGSREMTEEELLSILVN
ncbi:MAG: aminoacyl--tRNA ligase-related protein [Candidatus Campbellbacteria bacterium]|nr:aminoacyl--tRNA ligase-related protein [Candidatus Campbellbacteria bacterium]